MISSLIWPMIAGVTAVSLEVYYRHSDHFPWWATIGGVVITYGVYRTVHEGPTFLTGIATFQSFTLISRLIASRFILKEPLAKGNLVVAVALIFASIVGRKWK